MKEAIQKAIEGGYPRTGIDNGEWLIKLPDYAKSQIWLDPLFWQCLGKAGKWDEIKTKALYNHNHYPEWQYQWHRFIDHLAEGKEVEEFFSNLTKSNE